MKYELLSNDTIRESGKTLYRIRCIKSFYYVLGGISLLRRSGDLGGYIEKEYNLSQLGNCWIFQNAKVFDDAGVRGNALICHCAKVFNDAWVRDNAIVERNAQICGSALICLDCRISNSMKIDSGCWDGTSESTPKEDSITETNHLIDIKPALKVLNNPDLELMIFEEYNKTAPEDLSPWIKGLISPESAKKVLQFIKIYHL